MVGRSRYAEQACDLSSNVARHEFDSEACVRATLRAHITMANFPEHFDRQYQLHLKHLKLKGLRPKTIDAYARGMRRIGEYFSFQVDALSEDELVEYFTDLMGSHSWSGVKLDLYGLKFFTEHVLRKPWTNPRFIPSWTVLSVRLHCDRSRSLPAVAEPQKMRWKPCAFASASRAYRRRWPMP
jgi:Phage integrase, N-terminal SAM-like domain